MTNVFRVVLVMVVALVLVPCAAAQDGMVHKNGTPSDSAGSMHYRIYRPSGEQIDFETMAAEVYRADAVLVGEEHDDPIAHFLQAKLLRAVHEKRLSDGDSVGAVVLTLEMFERDVQDIVDEYLDGFISEKQFKSSARPWQNYDTDYRPAVEYARENGIPVVAANAPRRYASRVTQMGPESLLELPESARQWLPPLPYRQASREYIKEWNAEMADNGHGAPSAPSEPVEEEVALYPNMLAAQSLWDASMAFSIADALLRHPGATAVHFVGAFHVRNHTGIPEHLNRYRPGSDVKVIAVDSSADITKLDPAESTAGDYIILTDENLPRSHERR
ncbi:MAG: ChaN family lipoprotein [Rhodothermales bacterium]